MVCRRRIVGCRQRSADDGSPGIRFCRLSRHTRIRWSLVAAQTLDRALDRVQQRLTADGRNLSDEVGHLRELAEEAPVIELVNNLIGQAFDEGASDIHVEPAEYDFRVRFRLDGVLQTRLTLPRDRFDAVASRIKTGFRSRHRRASAAAGWPLGHASQRRNGRHPRLVVAEHLGRVVGAAPAAEGTQAIPARSPRHDPGDLALFSHWIREPHGIILITGPTGSGKSTTLYATLEEINDGSTKIVTVEEPVEYSIKGISQVHAQPDIGYTFARALRAILRQDPDKIMIGEIRDLETAQIAVQAALTGHMVFSTLHTNDSLSAFTRLVDMGVEPFLVASAVRLVMAQRLARRLCHRCAEPEEVPERGERVRSRCCDNAHPSSSRICRGGGVRSAAANVSGRGSEAGSGSTRWSV